MLHVEVAENLSFIATLAVFSLTMEISNQICYNKLFNRNKDFDI